MVMDTDLIIRPCREDECPAVLKLWQEAEAAPSKTDTIPQLRRLIHDVGDLFLVAEQDSKLVGTALGAWDGWRGHIYRLAVLPLYQRQGIGRALVLEAERILYSKGVKRISIEVIGQDGRAMSFWKSLEEIGYLQDNRIVRFAKTL